MTTRTLTFREAINEAIRLEMRRDPTVILMGEDVAGGATVPHLEATGEDAWGGPMGVTKGLVKEFGRKRVLDTPISESAFIGAAPQHDRGDEGSQRDLHIRHDQGHERKDQGQEAGGSRSNREEPEVRGY